MIAPDAANPEPRQRANRTMSKKAHAKPKGSAVKMNHPHAQRGELVCHLARHPTRSRRGPMDMAMEQGADPSGKPPTNCDRSKAERFGTNPTKPSISVSTIRFTPPRKARCSSRPMAMMGRDMAG